MERKRARGAPCHIRRNDQNQNPDREALQTLRGMRFPAAFGGSFPFMSGTSLSARSSWLLSGLRVLCVLPSRSGLGGRGGPARGGLKAWGRGGGGPRVARREGGFRRGAAVVVDT